MTSSNPTIMQHLPLSLLLVVALLYSCWRGDAEQTAKETAPVPETSTTIQPTATKATTPAATEAVKPPKAATIPRPAVASILPPPFESQPMCRTDQPIVGETVEEVVVAAGHEHHHPVSNQIGKDQAGSNGPEMPATEAEIQAATLTEMHAGHTAGAHGHHGRMASHGATGTLALPSIPVEEEPVFALIHDKFDVLLNRHVSSKGKVDYSGFKKDQAALETYLELLKKNPPKDDWSKNKEMAYWINLYNAFTIKTILEAYPVKSILDIDGGKVWDKRSITIDGKAYTLNDMVQKQLLERFQEPKVHFAVNCAAASCPPLLNKAWTEENIQRHYIKQANAFINHTAHNTLSTDQLELSQIFNWHADDFGGKDQVVAYIKQYAETDLQADVQVSFKAYDWSLNE